MSDKEYKLIREATLEKGKVKMTYRIYVEGVLQRIHWSTGGYITRGCCASTSVNDVLSEEVFPALTPEEVKKSFGRLELPEYAQIEGWDIYVPVSRQAIRKVTQAVTEWVKTGMEKCAALHAQRGMENWLWEVAAAESPELKWRPSEKE